MKRYSVKRIWHPALLVCLVVVCILLSVFAAVFINRAMDRSVGGSQTELKKDYILIDAGHGGEDGGCVASDGTVEKDINLAISLPLADMLRFFGYNVRLTRDGDYSIYDISKGTIRERKISDLKQRLELFNNSRMTISIHQNHFTQSQYFGTQLFYSLKNEESKELATVVRQTVLGMLQPDNTRELKKATKDIYLLDHTTAPAIIVECGFLSNAGELKKLKTADYQQSMAYAIACGILTYHP